MPPPHLHHYALFSSLARASPHDAPVPTDSSATSDDLTGHKIAVQMKLDSERNDEHSNGCCSDEDDAASGKRKSTKRRRLRFDSELEVEEDTASIIIAKGTGRSRRNPYGSLISPESSEESANPILPVISAGYRTTTTTLPRLPFVPSFSVLSDAAKKVARSIKDRVVEVVKHYELSDEESYYVDIGMRETKGCPETAEPTVFVVLDSYPKKGRAAVESAVKDVASFAHDELNKIDSSAPPFHIEVIDRRLVDRIHCTPVRERPDLLQSWDQLKRLVYQRLESNIGTKGHMTSIALFRYGLSETSADNPITIFITVDFESHEVTWPDVIHDIEQQLAAHSFPALYVHIEHNIGYLLAPPTFTLVPPTGSDADITKKAKGGNAVIYGDYSTVVNLGDPIGPAKYIDGKDGSKQFPGYGTLGCYVEVKAGQSSEWETYALTNYHVIRGTLNGFTTGEHKGKIAPLPPLPRCDLRRADEFGLAPGLHGHLSSIESPSRAKHNYTIWTSKKTIRDKSSRQQEIIQSNMDDEAKRRLVDILEDEKTTEAADMQKKVDFFDCQKHLLGKVYAASGFGKKTEEDGRLDWALVKVNKARVGTNKLPDQQAWQKTRPSEYPSLTYGAQLQPQTKSIRLSHSDRCKTVYKLGTTSGATCGEFHEFKPDVNLLDDRHLGNILSTEYVFQQEDVGSGQLFAEPGDSGSVVFDFYGGVVGLVFRGLRPSNDQTVGHAYVTPIEHVFKHIKESSKGKIVDIRIAQ
ncbi:hypothetical protein KAF25_009202 [Fusarium avenaceum]|uniref:Uncharacterized protein n=1 Tax=Fusarium avenaceum TaxID=40199 RepID=A0A9P7GSZ0_9HYPO|nr:hypothetical protein KAF25_009202 [Fusarium avenaceum]